MHPVENKVDRLQQINSFNARYLSLRQNKCLIARISGDYIYVDNNNNGMIKYFILLAYSYVQGWSVQLYSDRLSAFEYVTTDYTGSEIIDGTLDGAFRFCEYAYNNVR